MTKWPRRPCITDIEHYWAVSPIVCWKKSTLAYNVDVHERHDITRGGGIVRVVVFKLRSWRPRPIIVVSVKYMGVVMRH